MGLHPSASFDEGQASLLALATTDLKAQILALTRELERRGESQAPSSPSLLPGSRDEGSCSHKGPGTGSLCSHASEEQFFRSLDLLNAMVATGGLSSSGCQPLARAEEMQLVMVMHGNRAKLVKLRPLLIRVAVRVASDDRVFPDVKRVEVVDFNGFAHHKNYAELTSLPHDRVEVKHGSLTEDGNQNCTTLVFTNTRVCQSILDDFCHGYLPDFLVGVYPNGVQVLGEWASVADDAVAGASHVRRLQVLRGNNHRTTQKHSPKAAFSFGAEWNTADGGTARDSLLLLRILTPFGEGSGYVPTGTTVAEVKRELLNALQAKMKKLSNLSSLELAYLGSPTILPAGQQLCRSATLRVVSNQVTGEMQRGDSSIRSVQNT